MDFEIGSKVTVIDEDLSGTVIRLGNNWLEFNCEDGFTYRYPKSAVYAHSSDGIKFIPHDHQVELKEEDHPSRISGLKTIAFNSSKSIFDLHLEELLPDRIPTQREVALKIQLDYAEAVLNKAIRLRVKQLVFIHGMGQGILRDELRSMMRSKFPNVEFFDGDYQKYGQGATEVILHGLGSL